MHNNNNVGSIKTMNIIFKMINFFFNNRRVQHPKKNYVEINQGKEISNKSLLKK